MQKAPSLERVLRITFKNGHDGNMAITRWQYGIKLSQKIRILQNICNTKTENFTLGTAS